MDPNKVRYGLKKLYFAPYIEDEDGGVGTWGMPIPIPGAVSFDPTAQGQKKVFYADDTEYFVYTQSNGESGNLVVAKYPNEFLTHALGWIIDKNNALIKAANVPQGKFAILYEMQGDKCPIRRVLYHCSCGAPSSGAKTNEEGVEVQTETVELTASNLDFGKVTTAGMTLVKDANPEAFEDFFEAVLVPDME